MARSSVAPFGQWTWGFAFAVALGLAGCNCDPMGEKCTAAEAGTLGLVATQLEAAESSGTVSIQVRRTGGSMGAVSATLTVSGGSATPSRDYLPLTTTVSFADRDTSTQQVEVTIVSDQLAESDETIEFTLSSPGGCAQLSEPATGTLVIRDDDLSLPSDGGADDAGRSGVLDPGFGDDGKANIGFGGKGTGMVVQDDGKVVLVGGGFTRFQLARFDLDGGLDLGFGDGGTISTAVSGRQQQARGVAIQPDQKLVVVGENRPGLPGDDFDFTLVRYLPDGALDPSFGAGGIVTATGVTGRAFAIAIQPDGKLVVAGDDTASQATRVARFEPDGKVDRQFGDGGVVTTKVAGVDNTATNVLLTPTGQILLSGDPIGEPGLPTAVVRLSSSGALDSSFGDGGTVAISLARVGNGLGLQPDGKLVLVGSIETAVPPITTPRFAIVRLDPDGAIDTSFGTGGLVTTAFRTEGDQALSLLMRADGSFYVAGQVDLINSDFGVARYHPDGTLDPTFGAGGKLTFDFHLFNDAAENVAYDPQGRLVLGGFVGTVSRTGYGLARVLP